MEVDKISTISRIRPSVTEKPNVRPSNVCAMDFCKMAAAGTDYIVVDNIAGMHNEFFADTNLLKSLCDREDGIGGAGIVQIRQHHQTKFEFKFYNAQGAEVAFCANAACCAIALLYQQQLAPNDGIKFTVKDVKHEGFYESGETSVQVKTIKSKKSYNFHNYFVNTGIPYHVMYVDNLLTIDVPRIGRKVSRDRRYADVGGSNVVFVQLTNDGDLKARIYDRGMGREIFGCGTGAVACLVVEIFRTFSLLTPMTSQPCDRKSMNVQFPGGVFLVEFDVSDNLHLTNIVVTQSVTCLFQGKMRAMCD